MHNPPCTTRFWQPGVVHFRRTRFEAPPGASLVLDTAAGWTSGGEGRFSCAMGIGGKGGEARGSGTSAEAPELLVSKVGEDRKAEVAELLEACKFFKKLASSNPTSKPFRKDTEEDVTR